MQFFSSPEAEQEFHADNAIMYTMSKIKQSSNLITEADKLSAQSQFFFSRTNEMRVQLNSIIRHTHLNGLNK